MTLTDDELLHAYRAAMEEARTAPHAGFGGFGQNAVFAPANKAIELHGEIARRKAVGVPVQRIEGSPT